MGDKKPTGFRFLAGLGVFTLMITLIVTAFVGFNWVNTTILITNVVVFMVYAGVAADGLMETVLLFFEALLEGVMAMFSAIGDFFSGLFPG